MDHIHQYIRVSWKKRKFYMCAHPDCSHIKDKALLYGKRSICNDCREEMVLDQYALTVAKPKCTECRNTKATNVRKTIEEMEIF